LVTPDSGTLTFQQLDIALADGQHGEARLADLLLVLERQAEGVAQEVDGLLERVHGDRDVLDPLDLHALSPLQGCQRGEAHLGRGAREPLDDFLVERDAVGAALFHLFVLDSPG
jgi:hypothetical protein